MLSKKSNKMNKSESEVNVKISVCQKCDKHVRVAVEHLMNNESIDEFNKEVFKFNLAVKTISLLEYRKLETGFCNCANNKKGGVAQLVEP